MQPLVGGVGVGTRRWWSLPTSQVVFITEYVSSGSLKQFLKKTKKNHKAMNARARGQAEAPQAQPPFPRPHPTEPVRRQAWKRWCTQILSALR